MLVLHSKFSQIVQIFVDLIVLILVDYGTVYELIVALVGFILRNIVDIYV